LSKIEKKGECDDIDDDVDDDLKQILKVLCQGGYNVSKSNKDIDRSRLPKWSEILEEYGPPKILGLESCQVFRDKIKPNKRRISPAGIFNSGTNLLSHLLADNCDLKTPNQVPWGKHTPFSSHTNHTVSSKYKRKIKVHPYYETLPVVAIRDPYTWMESMCRQPYAASYEHTKLFCPNIIPYPSDIEAHPRFQNMDYIPVRVKYNVDNIIKYKSMPHLWNEWYGEYIEFESTDQHDHQQSGNTIMKPSVFPLLVVRMEDLVFHAETVVPQLCECAGGTLKSEEVQHYANVANRNHGIDISGGIDTGLLRSVIKYGNITNRRAGYPTFQLVAARDLLDSRLMDLMGYRYEEP